EYTGGNELPEIGWRRLKVTGDDYQFSGGLEMMAAAVTPEAGWPPGRAATDDHQTTIPKTDERESSNRKRDEECHEGGNEPPDRAQVFAGWPTAAGAAGQTHLANPRRSAGGDLASGGGAAGGGAVYKKNKYQNHRALTRCK